MEKKRNIWHRHSKPEDSGATSGPSEVINSPEKMKVRIKDPQTGELYAEFEVLSQHKKVDIELEWETQDDIAIIQELNGVNLTNEHLKTCADCWGHKLKNLREKNEEV